MKKFTTLREFFQQDEVKDIEAKLRATERQDKTRDGTKGFAFEDPEGNVVKVFVDSEQAEDFENAVSSLLNDEKGERREIADVLYELKPHFDIRDVEWPKEAIPEDEEVAPEDENQGGEDGVGQDEMDMDSESAPDELDTALDMGDSSTGDTESQAFSTLEKIIDMLKADAEAKEAEARAKQAEAESRVAKSTTEVSKLRAKQEEELLDMEEYNNRKKEQKEEEELRQKLLKYRHERKKNGDSQMTENYNSAPSLEITPEEEEILDMEDWEKEEKEKKQQEQIRKRVAAFRHRKKKQEEEERKKRESRYKEVLEKTGSSKIAEVDLKQYLEAFKSGKGE